MAITDAVNPRADGHQGRGALSSSQSAPARPSTTLRLRLSDTISQDADKRVRRTSIDIFAHANAGSRRVLRDGDPAGSLAGCAERHAAGVRGHAVVQAVLSLRGAATGWRAIPAIRLRRAEREHGRNHEWAHLYNADVISMPDKWEYPWYAAWDLAFHCVPLALVDSRFRQGAAGADAARVVHASQRAAAGV